MNTWNRVLGQIRASDGKAFGTLHFVFIATQVQAFGFLHTHSRMNPGEVCGLGS